MCLFHATKSELIVGDRMTDPWPTNYYIDVVSALESARPVGAPSRREAFFAAESQEFAVFFLMAQNVLLDELNLYRVDLPESHKSPFALVHEISKHLEQGAPVVGALASEYWSPKLDWNFFEHFGSEMLVREKIELPDLNTISLTARFDRDVDRAASVASIRYSGA